MCGIAGVLSVAPSPGLRTIADRMARRLRHRGPDGCGSWLAPAGDAALTHTRLAIFDGSPAAAQPMSIDDGRFTMTYNGAIYNFRSLREELRSDGVSFRTTSDTEVLLRIYQRHGARCVEHLQGMYAFVIWDSREQRAFLARDAFGIKPLYHTADSATFAFASEVRAIAASGLVSTTVDEAALYEYFRTGSVPEPRTILRDVRMLPAGATAEWRNGTLTISGPSPWLRGGILTGDDVVQRTRHALSASVDRHFEGDARVGVLLSGGIDSSAILALATRAGRHTEALSLALPGHPDDEAEDAGRVAKRFGVAHHVLAVNADHARAAFSGYAAAIDQPSIDGFNTYLATRFARQQGFTVVLSGVGADELFGGYPSFWRVPQLQRWHRIAALTGTLAVSGGAVLERLAVGGRAARIADLLQQAPSLEAAYGAFRGIYTRSESRQLAAHFSGKAVSAVEDAPHSISDRHPADTISMLELTRYVRNQLLRDSDVMSMASGVELRTPFLDRELAGVVWNIPAATRVQPRKRLLTAAVPELPSCTLTSRKKCFQLPFQDWLSNGWPEMFDGMRDTGSIVTGTWYRKWAVVALQQSLNNLHEAANG